VAKDMSHQQAKVVPGTGRSIEEHLAATHRRRFTIVSLPRSGSTTLAHVLGLHPEVKCLVEPFHPNRYDGRFHAVAENSSVDIALSMIDRYWNGIKHVSEASGWPFLRRPATNADILVAPRRLTILLVRRNGLRRIVSNHISRCTKYWIGTRSGFRERLSNLEVKELDLAEVRNQLERDLQAIHSFRSTLDATGRPYMTLHYEDLFPMNEETSRELMARVLEFLGYSPVDDASFASRCWPILRPDENQWASADVYRQIRGIDRIEAQVGSDATGWLFK
jgi:hypothetical protein